MKLKEKQNMIQRYNNLPKQSELATGPYPELNKTVESTNKKWKHISSFATK